MNLFEIIKNPSKFIFRDEKREARSEINIPNSNTQNTKSIYINFISDWQGFIEAVKVADFHWILRGKTGVLIKVVLPILILIFLFQNFYMQKKPDNIVITPPKIEDPGDILEKPKFVNQNYFTAIQNEEKFYLYSPNLAKTNIFGVRGIILDQIDLPSIAYAGYIPFTKESYFYFKRIKDTEGAVMQLNFYKLEKIKNQLTGKIEEKITDKVVEDMPLQYPSADEVYTKSIDGNLVMLNQFCPCFFVINSEGELIYSLEKFDNSTLSLFTYFNNEVYFIKKTESIYSIVKQNSNGEEIYTQNLTNKQKVVAFHVINSDRFLIAYEKPSDTSFYEVEMLDSQGKTIFKFIPSESENKLTRLKNIYFEAKNNNVFMLGGGIAKLFTVTGKELWIN